MTNKFGALFIFFWASIQLAGAQLPSGSTAPNFMAIDINGQNHNLYDDLNADKIVILEISAAWCPPCWAYHQSKALQNFYAAHGPSGDDKARVYWVEGDPNTNVACIYGQAGCNNTSAGNFADGTPYPILNDAAIATAFQITYYPSIFIICPNKRAYEVEPVSAIDLWEKAQVCPVAYGSNNAGIFEHDPGYNLPEICGGIELGPSFKMTNLGAIPLTSASILLKWNGNIMQTIDWQGNLPTYGEAPIQFDHFPVDMEGSMNTIITSINNNAGDDDFTNNYKNNSFSNAKHFDQTRVVLKIKTDDYARETYWELHDDTGAVLDRGGNQLVGPNGGGAYPLGVGVGPGTYSNNTLIKDTLFLPSAGCYSIHFVDAFGDGMCCNYGNGYYKLYNIDNSATPILVSNQFGAYDRHAFEAGMLSTGTVSATQSLDLRLFPNPASDKLFIEFESATSAMLHFQVFNALGQTMIAPQTAALYAEEDTLELSLQGIPDGLYFLSVTSAENGARPTVRKFVVRH